MAQNNHNGQNGHHHGPMLLKGCPTIIPSNDLKNNSVVYTTVFPNSAPPGDEPPSPVTPAATHNGRTEEWFDFPSNKQTGSRQRYSSLSEHKNEPETVIVSDYTTNKDSSSDSDYIDEDKIKIKKQDEDILPDDSKEGLFNVKALIFLILWYFFSFCTLFLNKNILSTLHGDPALLGASQLLMTTCLGFVQMYLPCGMYKLIDREGKPPNFLRNMILVGTMRFTTVVLGLISLKFVAVSFTETIKSSAPLFTVLMARTVLGERFSAFVMLSLVPIMSGLALCTAYEISFDMTGFIAAMGTNITDCLQNVYSKMLISGEKYRYTPAELQFYTSIASVLVQIPACYFLMDFDQVSKNLDHTMVGALLFNGLFFHLQSISAYVLMGYISPVTHSVSNTVKRAFLIWLSVIIFGNPVTLLSGLGTCIVIIGVLLYTKARQHDEKNKEIELRKGSRQILQA